MDYWKIQDIFHERMKKDYECGVITSPTFKPYFDWKFNDAPISAFTKQMCHDILHEAQTELRRLDNKYPRAHEQLSLQATIDDVWRAYRGYGEDCFLYSYLMGIESEITTIMMMIY